MKTNTKAHKINQKIGFHNEFRIVVTEFETDKCEKIKKKWEAKAYNLVLTQGLTKVAMHLEYYMSSSSFNSAHYARIGENTVDGAVPNSISFGGYIHMGTGSTTPDISDTALDTFIMGRAADMTDRDIDFTSLYAWYEQKMTILPAEYNGNTFAEIGLASGAAETSTNLSTRALIEDSEGSPITIEKTATVQIDAYSKLYVVLDTVSYNNTDWVDGPADSFPGNALLKSFYENDPWNDCQYGGSGGSAVQAEWHIYTGTNDTAIDSDNDNAVETQLADSGDVIPARSGLVVTATHRFETAQSNGKIKEFGMRMKTAPDGYSYLRSLFRAVLPITGVYAGTTFTDVEIGTGDDVEDEFTIGETDQLSTFWTWNEINSGTLVVKVDGVTQTETTDYTYNDSTGVITFESGSIPPSGDAVTASWTVPYIAKSNDYVLDFEISLTVAEGTVPT